MRYTKLALVAVVMLLLHTFASLDRVNARPSPQPEAEGEEHIITNLGKRAGCDIQLGVMYDDSQGNIGTQWTGAWTHMTNQNQPQYMVRSFSYTSQANAMVQLYDPFPAGQTHLANVTVWSSKKNDRGKFSIYIGKTLLGTGNQYTSASKETDTQPVFQIMNTPIPGGSYFVIKNDKGARFMGFDALQIDFCYY